ncbi:ATPase, T2SS/T4P/T4SS family [Allorhodopirellula heiligendammensis]|uniref:Type II secretion system protein E n=1 Tax=Allorhodopirellula heiligendammensis TaxID=2714739 RepID=A0A5C6C430_9BACT|nr:ATPase, T2SS/T4P/T4SS family [Allorhodopirellula heiligendammensis]TWU18928.1 putative type II secretion system protein E [Allorhodopirellula heiligendammensis]
MAQEPDELQLWQTVAPVEFVPKLAARNDAQALLVTTRQGAGYMVAGGQLAHAIASRATHVLMDFSKNACAMRYQVDGTWEQLPPLDRETGDAMLYALKQLCLMNPADRRGAQKGEVGLKVGKEKYALTVQSQGVPTGERVICRITAEKVPFEKLADLGMRDTMIEQFKEQLNSNGNIVLVTAKKGEGVSTVWSVAISSADRFIRDFQSFEPADAPEPEIINVTPNLFGGDTGKTEFEVVQRMVLREPDVLMFPNPPDPDALETVLEKVQEEDRQLIYRAAADSAMGALLTFIGRYPDCRSMIVNKIGCVLHQRLVRRLCDNCKVAFEPPPKLLSQLGIPAGRVSVLYQPFVPPPIEQQVDENGRPDPITPCHVCGGRAYYGRVGVFEMLRPGPQLREALGKTNDAGQLAAIAKSEGHRGMQSEAVMAVARGLTSLDELKRVFSSK